MDNILKELLLDIAYFLENMTWEETNDYDYAKILIKSINEEISKDEYKRILKEEE
jgi:hypothetical protein